MIFDERANRYDVTKLIFLHHNLDDENGELEETPVAEDPIDIPPEETKARKEKMPKSTKRKTPKDTKRKTSAELATEQISEELEKLKDKIPEDEFILIGMATMYEKIQLLDALAEHATMTGDIFLAMQIEKIISLIKHSLNFSAKET